MKDQIRCCDAQVGLGALPPDSIPCTLTSPPYDDLRDFDGHILTWEDFEEIAQELYRVTCPRGVVIWVVRDQIVDGGQTGTSFRQALFFKEVGFRLHNTLIFERKFVRGLSKNRYGVAPEFGFVFSKGKPRYVELIRDRENKEPGKFYRFTVRRPDGSKVRTQSRWAIPEFGARSLVWSIHASGNGITRDKYALAGHSAVMPEVQARDLIVSFSRTGDLVLDPFAGSGTTCKVALLNHRRYLGFESNAAYRPIWERRMAEAWAEYRRRINS